MEHKHQTPNLVSNHFNNSDTWGLFHCCPAPIDRLGFGVDDSGHWNDPSCDPARFISPFGSRGKTKVEYDGVFLWRTGGFCCYWWLFVDHEKFKL